MKRLTLKILDPTRQGVNEIPTVCQSDDIGVRVPSIASSAVSNDSTVIQYQSRTRKKENLLNLIDDVTIFHQGNTNFENSIQYVEDNRARFSSTF